MKMNFSALFFCVTGTLFLGESCAWGADAQSHPGGNSVIVSFSPANKIHIITPPTNGPLPCGHWHGEGPAPHWAQYLMMVGGVIMLAGMFSGFVVLRHIERSSLHR